jgi:hypothetical protein
LVGVSVGVSEGVLVGVGVIKENSQSIQFPYDKDELIPSSIGALILLTTE